MRNVVQPQLFRCFSKRNIYFFTFWSEYKVHFRLDTNYIGVNLVYFPIFCIVRVRFSIFWVVFFSLKIVCTPICFGAKRGRTVSCSLVSQSLLNMWYIEFLAFTVLGLTWIETFKHGVGFQLWKISNMRWTSINTVWNQRSTW
jgi:hypothetical protein